MVPADAQDEVIAALRRRLFDGFRHFGKEGIGNFGHHQPDRLGAALAQPPGEQVAPIAQGFDRLVDLAPRLPGVGLIDLFR
jgi:hypothetical protein